MADLIVSGIDDSSGRKQQAQAGDSLVDSSGNPISIGSSPTLLGTVTGVDLTTPQSQTAFTVPSGSKAIITDAYIQITAISGLTSHGQYQIQNSGMGRIFLTQQTPPNNFNAVDDIWSFTRTIAVAYADMAQASDQVLFAINTSATATTLTANVYVFGILV